VAFCDAGSDACSKPSHNDNDSHLHYSLHGDNIEISLHPSSDLYHIRIGFLQFHADEYIDRRQKTGMRKSVRGISSASGHQLTGLSPAQEAMKAL